MKLDPAQPDSILPPKELITGWTILWTWVFFLVAEGFICHWAGDYARRNPKAMGDPASLHEIVSRSFTIGMSVLIAGLNAWRLRRWGCLPIIGVLFLQFLGGFFILLVILLANADWR